MRRSRRILLLPFLLVILSAPVAAAEISAFVSIVPQEYFLHKIGGDRVEVHVMVPSGANPHTYEPAPRQMTDLSKADIYFSIGIPFESAWMERFKSINPDLSVVETHLGIERKPIERHDGHDHGHAHENGDGQASPDPHIWLSPPLVKIQAGNILKGLIAADPAHRNAYERNHAAFIREIDTLDAELRRRLQKGTEFMVFHPSWGYFADAYGLVQVPVEIEGKSPKAAEIQRLIRYAEERNIRTVLVQPQLSSRSAEMIAHSIHGRTVDADPLAGNWPDNLLHVADRILEK